MANPTLRKAYDEATSYQAAGDFTAYNPQAEVAGLLDSTRSLEEIAFEELDAIKSVRGIPPILLELWASQFGGCYVLPETIRMPDSSSAPFSNTPLSSSSSLSSPFCSSSSSERDERFKIERCSQETCLSFHYVGVTLKRKIFLCHEHKTLHVCSGLDEGISDPTHSSGCWKVVSNGNSVQLQHICWVYSSGVATEWRKRKWGRIATAPAPVSVSSLALQPHSPEALFGFTSQRSIARVVLTLIGHH